MFLKIKVQQSRIKNSFHRKILSQKNFLENFFFIVTYDTRKSKKSAKINQNEKCYSLLGTSEL